MRYAIGFGALAIVSLLAAFVVPWVGSRVLLAWWGLSFGSAAVAYLGLGAALLGKRADGELPWWSLALNGPFLVFGLASMRLLHLGVRERPWDEVTPGLWLGRRPTRSDRAAYEALAPVALVDLCAELPVSRARKGSEAYLSLPVLDTEAPSVEQLEAAVRWIDTHRAAGPVLVHCALGHSRSATVVIAWEMARGHPDDADRIEEGLRRVRPAVRLTPAQRSVLVQWRHRLDRVDR